MYDGVELLVMVGPGLFGRWMLTGIAARHLTRDRAMWDAQLVNEEERRGKFVQLIAGLWRRAFGPLAPLPPRLKSAKDCEQHLEDMRSVRMALPTLQLDGEVLRMTRRWLNQRFGLQDGALGPLPDHRLRLDWHDGLLRMSVGDLVFGCPATGVWAGECQVSLRKFLAIPAARPRGPKIWVDRSLKSVVVNNSPLTVPPAE